MLDPRWVYENLAEVKKRIGQRGAVLEWDRFVSLYEERLNSLQAFEAGRAEQRKLSEAFKKKGTPKAEIDELRARLGTMSKEITALESRAGELARELDDFLMDCPNLPSTEAPDGRSDADNKVIRTWGEPREFDFEARAHWDVGEGLGILDPEAAAKLSGARFTLYKGAGARLELALAQFMLDVAEDRGYTPIFPPFLVLDECMRGTGQLPKFGDEAFKVDDFYLIPTAEVPVTNIHRGDILEESALPINYVAYSSCFRREAGAAGRDTRGLTRLHQFQKVELVKFTTQEDSAAQHEALTRDAEEILRRLELPYRVMDLCTGDIGFSSSRTYDLEVWLPGQKIWREISSCSNFTDFQARRLQTRYRPDGGDEPNARKMKTKLVHTLNGSGLAVGRTIIAILENYQQPDGSVKVPEALRPYMRGLEEIRQVQPKGN